MMNFVINNLDKIFISLSGMFFLEMFMKYHNLKYNNEHDELKIKTEKIFHIEIYKKKYTNKNYTNNFLINNVFNKYNKFQNSLTIILKNNDTNNDTNITNILNYDIYNDVKFINPKNYLFYNNDNIIYTIFDDLIDKKDCIKFLNIVQKNRNIDNIKYKIIKSLNSYCLYENNKLKYISDNKDNLLIKSLDDNFKYLYISLMCGLFIHFYK